MYKVLKDAFTLIEMLIVIAIIGILVAISSAVFLTMSKDAEKEGAANQIKLILGACEQFKADFGMYPPGNVVNNNNDWGGETTRFAYDDWFKTNALAWYLAKSMSGNTSLKVNRNNPYTWRGDYLTDDDLPESKLAKPSESDKRHKDYTNSYISGISSEKVVILDFWGKPLAYCAPIYEFIKEKKSGALRTNVSASSNTDYYSKSTSAIVSKLKNPDDITMSSVNYVAYSLSNKPGKYHDGRSKTMHLPSVNYSLNGTWNNTDLDMPELWSYGEDDEISKIHYNKDNSSIDEDKDKDNVGGNMNVLKIKDR